MTTSFLRDSDMFKIPFLRGLLSANIDPTIKKKYNITYTKSQQQPIFVSFMEECLQFIVKIPPGATSWKETIAGKLIGTIGPDNKQVYDALKNLCDVRIDKFISAASDQSQCQYVGIKAVSGCTYNLNETYPIINNGVVNPSRNLWTSELWCNNCWLCSLPLGAPNSSYPYTKQCEHILPYLTGSVLLGTATNTTMIINEHTKREYGQSHAICNMFKNQGEFIKFDQSVGFNPDIVQICNYIKELTGVNIDPATGLELSKSNIVSTNTIDSFTQVFTMPTNVNLSRDEIAGDMYKTIKTVIETICTQSLNPSSTVAHDFMAKLLYTAILNFLVDSIVRHALISSKGETADFRSNLHNFYKKITVPSSGGVFGQSWAYTHYEVVNFITAYQSKYTTERITERLKKYINNDNALKPRKYMIIAKSLYDNFISTLSGNTFGTRSIQVKSVDKSKSLGIKKSTTKKQLSGHAIESAIKEDEELLQYYKLLSQPLFKNNLLSIVNGMSSVTYGDLYSKLTYATSSGEYKYDDEFSFENEKIVLPALVYNIYEYFERMSDAERVNFTGVIYGFFPLLSNPLHLKIFSAYIYGIKVFSLLDYDLDRTKKELSMSFGKKNNKLINMSINELKTKLKSVKINITKITRTGKRLPLTRIELERKAIMFKNLQIRAKKLNVRLMYKSKTRGYVYKTYNRLINEIERVKSKRVKSKRVKSKRVKFG